MSTVSTRIVELDPARISREIIAEAADILRAGGLVAFPTGAMGLGPTPSVQRGRWNL